MTFPSKLIEDAIKEFSKLPGIGEKTALRLVLFMLKQDVEKVEVFGERIAKMCREIKKCKTCHNLSDFEICEICKNPMRDHSTVCVVESMRDVIAIESTGTFNGTYHVLGGVISPVDGIGPDELTIQSLIERVKENDIEEIVMALNPTMEGDTTIFYISKKMKDSKVFVSTIARGVAFGGELEYTDELTLSRSIATRMPYENYLVNK